MATRIRLRRIGRKKLPLYRIVIADQEAPRDGRFIEIIGTYNPKGQTAADKVKVDADKARQWIAKGATPSNTVQSLLKQAGVFQTAGTAKRKRETKSVSGNYNHRPDAPLTLSFPAHAVWSPSYGSRGATPEAPRVEGRLHPVPADR